jgi:hypothetical protein
MENTETLVQPATELVITPEIRSYLKETASWGKFLAIMGYIGMALMVIGGLAVMAGFSFHPNFPAGGFPMIILGIVYILVAVLYFFPVTYLFRFSDKIKAAVTNSDMIALDAGFLNLKSLFRFMGIMTIVVLSIYTLAIIIVVPIAFFMGFHQRF